MCKHFWYKIPLSKISFQLWWFNSQSYLDTNLIELLPLSASLLLLAILCAEQKLIWKVEGHLQKKPHSHPALPAGGACSEESQFPYIGNEVRRQQFFKLPLRASLANVPAGTKGKVKPQHPSCQFFHLLVASPCGNSKGKDLVSERLDIIEQLWWMDMYLVL